MLGYPRMSSWNVASRSSTDRSCTFAKAVSVCRGDARHEATRSTGSPCTGSRVWAPIWQISFRGECRSRLGPEGQSSREVSLPHCGTGITRVNPTVVPLKMKSKMGETQTTYRGACQFQLRVSQTGRAIRSAAGITWHSSRWAVRSSGSWSTFLSRPGDLDFIHVLRGHRLDLFVGARAGAGQPNQRAQLSLAPHHRLGAAGLVRRTRCNELGDHGCHVLGRDQDALRSAPKSSSTPT